MAISRAKKKAGNRWVKIRSKNETADPLRRAIPANGKNVILRLGSKTPTEEITDRPVGLEINSAEACVRSNNKIKMKEAFAENEVKTAEWLKVSELSYNGDNNEEEFSNWSCYPSIIKHIHSCRGEGIFYIEDVVDLFDFIEDHKNELDRYIIEKYYTYNKEYRLHVNENGCFYACRKMLKNDAEERWHRHDNNSIWILPENELFAKPLNWEDIVAESIKAMKSVGLDLCAVDVKVQSKKETPKFIILETNSGPSLGEVGVNKYIEELTNLIENI